MKSYILVQLADGTYKNVDTQDIEQIFKNDLGSETVIFKDGWGIKSERLITSSSSRPIYNNQGSEHYLSSDKPDTYLWLAEENTKQAKEIKRLQEQLKEANELLLDFCSDDECRFDHNGYCQEHDSCEGDYKCIQKDLKQYLEKWDIK